MASSWGSPLRRVLAVGRISPDMEGVMERKGFSEPSKLRCIQETSGDHRWLELDTGGVWLTS
jgi:hypothetical protein